MLKLQRPTNRPSKQRERFDFKFSNFQALQVPKGWDRLFVSLVSAETGKTVAKLGKALVKNGSCHWSETISESIHISRHDSSKSYEECNVKFVVSTGSTRSNNALGEAIINMAQHATSRTSAAVSQPLKKCSYGTIFQVKIQRATLPRSSKIRDNGSKKSESQEKIEGVNHFDMMESKSDNSSDGTNKPPTGDLATSSRPLRSDNEEASESGTVIINSFSSLEGSYERENSSVENAFRSEECSSDERRGGGSNGGGVLPHHYSADDDSPAVYLREDFQSEAAMSRWSVSNVASSRNLLEAAEDTIEELRAEAKMWERNARKLMIDLDISRKDYSDLSKKQAELGAELSAAYSEQDGLRRQVEKVMEERLSADKATREAPIVQSDSVQKEMKNEMKYQRYLNDELGQQLNKSQESNIELVSILQELEETIEQQRVEIENLSSLKFNIVGLQNSLDRSSEENKALLLQLKQLQESEKNLKSEIQLLDEALRDKTDELEKERESNREILSQVEGEYHEEITSLEGELHDYIKEKGLKGSGEHDFNLMGERESLREKVRVLEKECSELSGENLELVFKLKDSNKTNITKCSSFDSMTSESEVNDPKYQLSNTDVGELKKEVEIAGFESSLHFAEILEQMDVAFQLLMKPWYTRSSGESGDDYLHGLMISDKVDTTRMSVEHIRSLLHELNKLLGTRIAESDYILRDRKTEINNVNAIISETRKRMEESILEVEELENFKARSEDENANLIRELEQKRSEIGHMEADFLEKQQQTYSLLQRQKELEAEVSELQKKSSCLEQGLEMALRERKLSSECMENLQSEIISLNDVVSSHVSVNTSLERDMKELKIRRDQLENTLLGLQEENTRLQECISDQEAQVHQLKDEKRGCLQEMESFKSCAMSLREEIRELKDEADIQIFELKQKTEDIRKLWLESQEECLYLKGENKALQESSTSSVLGTAELKRENEDLHEKCLKLEDQLSDMEKSLIDVTTKVQYLQSRLTEVQDDFVLRENHLKSELDALVKENSYQKEKLAEQESLSQLLLEKTTEFQSLMKEVELLGKQLSDVHEEREIISSEVSSLLTEKAELQASLQEVKWEHESTKIKLKAAMQESELNVQDLKDQLAASNQSYERILKLLENYRKLEEKLKTDLNDVELKHTISNYESQQLMREMSSLKVQLQSIYDLEDEVSTLKSELEECKLDKGKMELALHTISRDYEELKAEKLSLFEKISVFEDAMYELEEYKRSKSCLEEKLVQMEKDLSAKEILSIQNEGLKNEITELKRSNVQFQQKMYRLEVEKDEYLKKVQALEDSLKLVEERNVIHKEGAHNQDPLVVSGDNLKNREFLENEFYEGIDANNRFLHERQRKGGGVVARERYERTKSSLETELRDLRERYLNMSIKYAEVEEQREGLVMKLKATRTGKRWFS